MDSGSPLSVRDELYPYFGTFTFSMLTWHQFTMAPGAWAKMGRLLIMEVHWGYALVFVSYGWLVSFTFMRVITALFLKQVLAAAAVDPETAMQLKEKEKGRNLRQ